MKQVMLVLASALALGFALVAPGAFGAVATVGPAVTVQIKAFSKTLLAPTAEHGEKGWITKGGTPRGKCSGDSAAGALDLATHGRWTGKYYASVGGIFVTSIDGVKPKGSNYWAFYVNGKSASTGICAVGLRKGARLLFKEVK